jgi:short-subunit dehydrogenase
MKYSTALVTGASSGLGRGLALALARRGTHVLAAARRKAELDALAAESALIEPMILDVSDGDATHAAVAALDARTPLDLVIANAGIGGPTHGKKLDWARVKQMVDVNITGAFATIAGALPGMVARDRGHIVGISSLAAWRGLPTAAAYSASKAALATFLDSLRVDLHDTGVAVTTIYPGFVRTPLNEANADKLPFIMKTDDAVEIMLRAIDHRQATCSFPLPLVIGTGLLPLMPASFYAFAAGKLNAEP